MRLKVATVVRMCFFAQDLNLQQYARVVVEQSRGRWFAWLADDLFIACEGQWPSDAIRALFEAVGTEEFELTEMLLVGDEMREDRLEFLIPYRHRIAIPTPSRN
jgi:hypothetical protein